MTGPPDAIDLHAESIPDQATVLRWVLPDDLLPAIGRVVAAPGALGELLAPAGPIVRAIAERGALWTWLAGPDWATWGVPVRDAIAEAGLQPAQWRIEAAGDEVLGLVARDVIERGLGSYIASHGGQISLLAASDGLIEVELSGACAHCPAAGLTLHQRIERAIRDRVGGAVEVRANGGCDENRGRPSWWPRRPGLGA